MKRLAGLLVALVTPLDNEGNLIADAAGALVDHYIAQGADGLYALGWTGEGAYLTVAQRKAWAAAVVGASAGRIPVAIHVGYGSEADAVELATHAAAIGADAIASVLIRGDNRFEPNLEYFRKLTAVAELPFYIYWTRGMVTGDTGRRVEAPELVDKMASVSHFAGIKYTDTDMYYLERLKHHAPDLTVLTGMDAMCIAGGLMGSDGSIGALQAVACRHMKTMWQKLKGHDYADAIALQTRANNLYEYMNLPGVGVLPAVKAILRHAGLPAGRTSPRSNDVWTTDESTLERLFAIHRESIVS